MLVSIIQSRPLLAFNGPSANVLSGQRGPGPQRRFNGCNDERVKSERGDPVSFLDEAKGRQDGGRGEGAGRQATSGKDRWRFWTGTRAEA